MAITSAPGTSNGSADPASPLTWISRSQHRLANAIRSVFGFLVLLVVVWAGWFYSYASHRSEYLSRRNLRALAAMGSRVESSLASATQVLGSPIEPDARDSAAPFIPLYDHLAVRARQGSYAGRLTGSCTARGLTRESGLRPSRWDKDPERPFCLHTMVVPKEQQKPETSTAALNAANYLGWILRKPADAGIFDQTFLLDTDGVVLLHAGASELALTRLNGVVQSALSPRKKDAPAPLDTWATFRLKPGIIDVQIAGSAYRLFIAPCCVSAGGLWQERSFVLAGLVSKQRFVLQSLKISLSTLTIVSLLLVLAVLSWPLLKLRFSGERQRVLASDGARLALSSLLGAAVCTILALDLYAYAGFRAELDGELARLAGQINKNLTREMTAARASFAFLVSWTERAKVDSGPDLLARLDSLPATPVLPVFESWALIDAKGMQSRKWSTDHFMQPLVPVKDRYYFREALARRAKYFPSVATNDSGLLLPDPSDPDGYVLESIQSWTTGQRRVVIAAPYRSGRTPVAAITLHMVSVIEPVLPAGLGFAVVDSVGRVLFHADQSRNQEENFFTEADQNKDLRAALLSHSEGLVNMLYGGADHRAYVTPVPGQPWSVITFRDKQSARITNAEWVATSGYLTALYTLLLVLLGAAALLVTPRHRISWLWPDRRLRVAYDQLALVFGLLLVAFVAALWGLERDLLLQASALLPLITIALTMLHLERRGAILWPIQSRGILALVLVGVVVAGLLKLGVSLLGSKTPAGVMACVLPLFGFTLVLMVRLGKVGRSGSREAPPRPIAHAYLAVAVLFLLLVGALPAAGFFKVAYGAHTEALVKHRQLQFARALNTRQARIERAYSEALGSGKSRLKARRVALCSGSSEACGLDVYDAAFQAGLDSTGPRPDSRRARPPTALVGRLLSPYRPESSLEWRALLSDTSSDSAWSWSVAGNRLYLESPRVAERTLSSPLPVLRPTSGSQWWLLLGGVVLPVMLALGWLAKFVARRFFLIEVTDPVPSTSGYRIGEVGDTNLLVVCRDCAEEDLIVVPPRYKTIDVKQELSGRILGDLEWLRRDIGVGTPVLVKHFEHQRHDPAADAAKLRMVDSLVHDLGSTVIVVQSREANGSPLGMGSEWSAAIVVPGGPEEGRLALESFVLVDAGRLCKGEGGEEKRRWAETAAPDGFGSPIEKLIASESRCDPRLKGIWEGVKDGVEEAARRGHRASRNEMLDLLGERAEFYYDAIWASCRPAERVVLANIAEDALANEKDRRVLRRLLARGLIRREPEFRVMSETFRQYLVRHAGESKSESSVVKGSAWDGIRRPMLVVLGSGIFVLFVTQQELWNAANVVILGLSAGVPAFARVIGFFGGRRPDGAPAP